MKRLLPLAILFICISCLTEEGADPGKGKTFFRYYNGGHNDEAQAFEETPDRGFIILAYTEYTKSNPIGPQETRIKLIKTDRYGNETWRRLYPSFDDTDFSFYKGHAMLLETDGAGLLSGFTIVGDSIDAITGESFPYILQTNSDGTEKANKGLTAFPKMKGVSIAKDGDGYLVLGESTVDNIDKNAFDKDMILIRLFSDLSVDWFREYGAGKTTNINSLYIKPNADPAQNDIFWVGTVTLDGQTTTDIRFISTKPDWDGTVTSPNIGASGFNEEIGNICFSEFGPTFNIVGTTDQLGSRDIVYERVSLLGDSDNTVIIGDDVLAEEGNAICTTSDQGTIIIATSGSDEGSDYYLIKLNYSGDVVWSKTFGSEKEDKGISVKQCSDGSYVVLGRTKLGGLSTIMLTKRNSTGNIE